MTETNWWLAHLCILFCLLQSSRTRQILVICLMPGWLNCHCQGWEACISFLPTRVGFYETALGESVMPADSAVLCLAGLRCSLESLPPRSLPAYPGSRDQSSSAMMTVHGAAHTLPTPPTPPPSPDTSWAVL